MPSFRRRPRTERRRVVTQEPALIAEEHLGRPLGGFRRRLVAFLVDLIVMGLIVLPLFAGLSALSLHRADPELWPAIRAYQRLPEGEERAALRKEASFRFFRILGERRPELMDPEALAALEAGELENFWELFGDEDSSLVLTLGNETSIGRQNGQRQIVLGTDILLGGLGSFLTWGAALVGWFTLITWFRRGRTPAKWIFRLRVVRLDGKRLTLWDSFSRAGGYGASAATLFLGFLEAAWHPNRQALHDKVSATVVLRDPPPREGHVGLLRRLTRSSRRG